MDEYRYFWSEAENLGSKSYKCGHCGNKVASREGYHVLRVHHRETDGDLQSLSESTDACIAICHECSLPTFFAHDGSQMPSPACVADVRGISDESVREIYREAGRAHAAGAFTASALCCRKILMNVAVSQGADKNKSFAEYVQFLLEQRLLPKPSKDWVDWIRRRGNDAAHEIEMITREESETLLQFSEMLLRIVYEFRSKIPQLPTTTPHSSD